MSLPQLRGGVQRFASALARSPGSLLFALALGVAIAFYAWTIWDGARRTTDWLLIVPATLVGIGALILAVAGDLRQLHAPPADIRPEPDRELAAPPSHRFSGDVVGFALMVLVLGYALALPWLGFDLGTFLFVGIALLIQGERRLARVGLVSLITAGLFVYVFTSLLGVRLPTVLI